MEVCHDVHPRSECVGRGCYRELGHGGSGDSFTGIILTQLRLLLQAREWGQGAKKHRPPYCREKLRGFFWGPGCKPGHKLEQFSASFGSQHRAVFVVVGTEESQSE